MRLKSVTVLAATIVATQALAQSKAQDFPDNAANHWAYVAVRDLANRGLVKGYKDSKSLVSGDMSRFEFASLVSRALEKLHSFSEGNNKSPEVKKLTQDTLNEVVALVETFGQDLKSIQTDLSEAKQTIEDLRQDVLDVKDAALKAGTKADESYGAGPGRKFSISGYIQARYISAGSTDHTRFPAGSPPSSSAYNGNYMQGGNGASTVIRRSRVKVTGEITQNTKYAIQLDASGLTSGTNQAVTVREGNISYTLGDGSSKNPTFTVGLFANPFGYILPLTSAAIPYPDRPLAFNETSAGLFASQDYDRGAQLRYAHGPTSYSLSFVNGSGLGTNDTDQRMDTIARAAYQSPDKKFGAGVSFYDGQVSYATSTPPYANRKKQLFGVDAQFNSPQGVFVLAEYVSGKFEQRSWFDQPTLKLTTAGAPGNEVAGYYATVGYTGNAKGPHPWTVAASYDVFQRSKGGIADSGNNWDDVNWGYGLTYGLDAASRIRLWYVKPTKVAHPAAQADPKKFGLLTVEYQVKF